MSSETKRCIYLRDYQYNKLQLQSKQVSGSKLICCLSYWFVPVTTGKNYTFTLAVFTSLFKKLAPSQLVTTSVNQSEGAKH